MENIKLNIFEYYSHDGVVPIENNMTKNLAVVLKQNPLALHSFINLITKKSNETTYINEHSRKYQTKFIFQKSISKISFTDLQFEEIIGVTLTTANVESWGSLDNEDKNTSSFLIPDLLINYRRKLYIIEVKRTSEYARPQLMKQINRIRKEIDNDEIIYSFADLNWADVVKELYNVSDKIEHKDYVLNDYLQHIENRLPALAPISNFERNKMNKMEHLEKRISLAINELYKEDATYSVRDNIFYFDIQDIPYLKKLAISNVNQYNLIGHFANTKIQGESF